MSDMIDFPTLTSLEQLLASASDPTSRDEALRLCATARSVQSAMHLQLQCALTALRCGWSDEAAALIERALGIGERWARSDAQRHDRSEFLQMHPSINATEF